MLGVKTNIEALLVMRKTLAAVLCCAVTVFALSGCASKAEEKLTMGEFPQRGPLVIGSDSQGAASAYDAASEDLSETQWEVLEQFAPRSTWNRIRKLNKEVREARKNIARARAASYKPVSKVITLPDVVTEKLGGGRIQMYYNVRHFGGVNVKSSGRTGLHPRKISVSAGNLKPLAALVLARLGGKSKGSVAILASEHKLIIACAAAMKRPILELLARVDVPQPQVEISARIFESRHDMDFQAGVKLLLTHLGDRSFGAGANLSAESFANTVMDPIAGTLQDPSSAMRIVNLFNSSGWSSDATIQALAKTGLVKMVSSPRMTVIAGKTGYIMAGQEMPIASARISNNNVITDKVVYKPVGVQMYVTPQIVGPDMVKLHVVTVVSSLRGFRDLPGLDFTTTPSLNPILNTREAETFVTVKNGSALVIGGLRMVRDYTREDKIPLLGDIPFLGWLFKSHRSQKEITDLYFFITPKIINPQATAKRQKAKPKAKPKVKAQAKPKSKVVTAAAKKPVAKKRAAPKKIVKKPATKKPAAPKKIVKKPVAKKRIAPKKIVKKSVPVKKTAIASKTGK